VGVVEWTQQGDNLYGVDAVGHVWHFKAVVVRRPSIGARILAALR